MMKNTSVTNADLPTHSMANNAPDIKQHVNRDLAMRSRGGIFIYLAVWLITAIWSNIIQTNPVFFYCNTFLILTISILRIAHYMLLMHRNLNTDKMYLWLVFLILISAFHWGILSTWIIFSNSFQTLHYPYMIILSAFAIGGTTVLSISSAIRVLYPLFIFIPVLITGIVIGGTEYNVLGTLLIFALFYVYEASRVSHKDYWNAIYSRMEADARAKQMEQLSITDQLTGLNNRMYFSKRFSDEWKRCSRLRLSLSVILIDLDHFKLINDTHGHLAGDESLRKVAEVMRSVVKRDTDVVARYGGEEFIIILPDINLATSIEFAKKLVIKISEIELTWEEKSINVTCSLGLASIIPDQNMNSQSLLKAVDKAMYQAKDRGRNQYCIAQ